MHKRTVLFYSLGVLALAAVAFAATTAFLGHAVHTRYERMVRDSPVWLQELPVETEMASYESGLFGAEAVTFYHIAGRDDPFLEVRHDIRYGPLLFGPGILGAAAVRSRVEPAQGLRSAHPGLVPSGPYLTARSRIGFDGGVSSRIVSRERTWRNGTREVAWKGLQGRVRISGGANRTVEAELNSPGFRLSAEDPEETMIWQGLTLDLRSRLDPSGTAVNQTAELRAERMQIRNAASSGSMEAIVLQSRSRVAGGLAHGSMEFRFASFNGSGYAIEQGRLVTGLRNLDRDALERMATLRRDAFAGRLEEDGLDRSAVRSIVKDLLRSSPVFELSRLRFRTRSGTTKLSGTVAFQGENTIPLEDTGALLKRIEARASLEVPKRFAAQVAAVPATFAAAFDPERRGDAGGGGLRKHAKRQAERWLRVLRANGLITSEGGNYTTSAQLLDGRVEVNGMTLLDLSRAM